MIRILIVDDEAIERTALQRMIERGVKGAEVAGQAENGDEAVQMAGRLAPDLILMDIQMPGLNWIEAIRRIQAMLPAVKFVMVTAYDMFDYARQAIQLGVKDYLLKPSKTQTIVETIQKVAAEVEEEKLVAHSRDEERRKLQRLLPIAEVDAVTQLLLGHVHDVHLEELVKLIACEEFSYMFVVVVNVIPLGRFEDEQAYKAVKAKIRETAVCWIGPMSAGQIPVIVFGGSPSSYRSLATSLVRQLDALQTTLRSHRLFTGIGGRYVSLDEVRSSYHEALLASGNTELPAKYLFYDALRSEAGALLNQPAGEKQLVEEARRGNWLQVEHGLLQIVRQYEQGETAVAAAQRKAYELAFVVSRLLLELGAEVEWHDALVPVPDYAQLKARVGDWAQRMARAYAAAKSRLEPSVLQQIKRYIDEHAHENMSLELVAEHVRLSPFYVSKLFKEQFETNYIDYLTECRIDKAKRLLADPDKSLKEIAYEVGYHDPNYFSRVFRKLTELSPSDYRKELLARRT